MANDRPRVFLDTSAVFTAIWSGAGGARELFVLGEGSFLQLVISRDVLSEIDDALRKKAPEKLAELAVLLDRAHVEVSIKPSARQIKACREWVDYEDDAIVLAGAWIANVLFFVTLDRKHFLNNVTVREAVSFEMGTPGDCLAWYRRRLLSETV